MPIQQPYAEIVSKVMSEVNGLTMTPPESLEMTIRLALASVDNKTPGVLAEFGAWKGGSSFAMLLAQRYVYGKIIKPVYIFDSFQGLPVASEPDGPLAFQYQSDPDHPWYQDNCRAPVAEVREAAKNFNFSDEEAIIIPGWFEDTFPSFESKLRDLQISLLRIDCDFYEPVRYVLDRAAHLVIDEGAIILDDYYFWDGCARAVHSYLSYNNLSWRLRPIGYPELVGAWMVKRSHRADLTHGSSALHA